MINFDRSKNYKIVGTVGLAILALAGNAFGVEFFFGVEFIFGSIATMIALVTFGPVSGLVIAAVSSTYTYFIWHHPFAVISFGLEAVCVALVLRRLRGNVAIAASAYWVFFGMPLVWFSYHYGLKLSSDGAMLVAVKQGANGILNAIAAYLIVTYLPIQKLNGNKSRKVTVFQHMFNVFVAIALIPAVALVLLDARRTVDEVEREIKAHIETLNTSLSLSIHRWRLQHEKAVEQLSIMAEDFGISDHARLQKFAEESQQVWNDFHGIFFADTRGTTIAFTPLQNPLGEPTLGLNFSDRPYFKVLKDGRQLYVSEVFMARGGIFEPVVNIASRIDNGEKFAGIVVGTLNLDDLRQIFREIPGKVPFRATLVESNGTIIASTEEDLLPLNNINEKLHGAVSIAPLGYFRRSPTEQEQNPMAFWAQSSLGKTVDIPGNGQWRLLVEVPIAGFLSVLNRRYIEVLSFLIGFALIILGASAWIAAGISRPLSRLSQETTNLPERLHTDETISWPTSNLAEIDVLNQNFKVTLDALKKRFDDLEKSKRQLNRANAMKDEFLAVLSHELRTPLNAIVGHSELLKAESLLTEQSESVDAIYRNAHAQNQIIGDLLDVSAIITGKLAFKPDFVSLNEIINAAVRSVESSAELRHQTIEVKFDSRDQVLHADPTRLQQVVWNLLSNAIKFTPDHGTIKIETSIKNDGSYIRVTDSGKGIDPSFLPHMFDRFRQEDSSITRGYGGLGLGLSIVKQIVDYHEGTITAESQGKNEGSSFLVFLPAALNSDQIRNSSLKKITKLSPASAVLSGIKVLVVDDDADARALSMRFLKGAGAIVELAQSAQEGFQKFSQFRPDVVISDIGMPDEDGYYFLKTLRTLKGGPHTPVAALTAFAMESDRTSILTAGFEAHITKPVTKADLIGVVANLAKHSTA